MGTNRLIWIPESCAQTIQQLFQRWQPLETGGLVFGYWDEFGREAVVTKVTGPGPDAVHERHRYVPDYAFDRRESAVAYNILGNRSLYLGDWHTHPGGGGSLSKADRRTLRKIAQSRQARRPNPVMVIASDDAILGTILTAHVGCLRSLLGVRRLAAATASLRLY